MPDTSLAGVDIEEVLLRLTRYSQALFGAFRARGFEGAETVYPGGDGPEDLTTNLIVRFLDPRDHSVEWKDGQSRPNTERVLALLKKALDRDFLDLKKSKRYTTTVYPDRQSGDEGRSELTLAELAVYLETPEGVALKKERVRLIIEAFADDPKAREIVSLQLHPDGYQAFTNQELAQLLDTTVDDIENRKKRVKNRLLQILQGSKEEEDTHG